MGITQWPDLPDSDKETLTRLASTFGASGPNADGFTFPSDDETKSIAIEMYTFSALIIERLGGKTNATGS